MIVNNKFLSKRFKSKFIKQIDIHDSINKETTEKILYELEKFLRKACKSSILILSIHSIGGSVYEGLRILEILTRMKKKEITIITVLNSIAFSIALHIFAFGDIRFVNELGYGMIHKPRADNPKTDIKHVENIHKQIDGILIDNCLLKDELQSVIENHCDNELYLSSQDLIEYGLADHIGIPNIHYKVSCQPVLSVL